MFDLGNPRDRVLPFLLFCVAGGFLVLAFVNRDAMSPLWLFIGTAIFAFGAGAMFMMFTDRRGPR